MANHIGQVKIGEYLKGLRESKLLSLRQAEKLSKVNHNLISRIEKGVDKRSGYEVKPSSEILKHTTSITFPY